MTNTLEPAAPRRRFRFGLRTLQSLLTVAATPPNYLHSWGANCRLPVQFLPEKCRMKSLLILAVLCFLTLAPPSEAADYTLKLLGPDTSAVAINNNGQVAGNMPVSTEPGESANHAFLFD